MKFIDGNLLNAQKRLEIVRHEYDTTRQLLKKEGKYEKQAELKKAIKDIELQQIAECEKVNRSLKLKDVIIEREFNNNDQAKFERERVKAEFVVRELDYTTSKVKEMEDKEQRRSKDLVTALSAYEKANDEYKAEIDKWRSEVRMGRKSFERLLKAYISNGETLDGLKLDYNLQPEDPDVAEREKIQKKRKDQLEKELRHNRLQINRIHTEIQSKSIDVQRDINRIKKETTEKRFELERVEHKLK